MDFDETWYEWSTHCPLQVLLFFGQIRPGADPGRGQNRSQGVPFFTSSDRNATATHQMHSSDLEAFVEKFCYFWFHSEVKFLTRFEVFLDLVILVYFNAISIDFYAVKSLICINFVYISCL